MDRRIELLEQDLRSLRDVGDKTGKDVAYIKGKLDDMPTKDWMNSRLLTLLALLLAGIAAMIRYIPSG